MDIGANTITPLLLTVSAAAKLASVSVATWWRLDAAGKVPPPVKVSCCTRWRLDQLERWTQWGCPSRVRFLELENNFNPKATFSHEPQIKKAH